MKTSSRLLKIFLIMACMVLVSSANAGKWGGKGYGGGGYWNGGGYKWKGGNWQKWKRNRDGR